MTATSRPDANPGLSVAVTGPTGTLGHALMAKLECDERIDRVIGIARRPFDPVSQGWTKMRYHRGDVRDRDSLDEAFAGIDVVVHLAFLITGTSGAATTRNVNIDGTLNAFEAAAEAGASRFVYTSSAAAYGFHTDNPVGITEDWPTRVDPRFFYAAEKAELEDLLQQEQQLHPELALYVLRPPIVVGPHARGAKEFLPAAVPAVVERVLRTGTAAAAGAFRRLPIPAPVLVPPVPLQFVHEDDVGAALLQCVIGAGPPGAYNIASPETLTAHDLIRELGFAPVGFPLGLAQRLARGVAAAPLPSFLPPVIGWAEALSHPVIIDTAKARRELGWMPTHSGLDAFRSMLGTDG